MLLFETVRIIIVAVIAFFVALIVTPFWSSFLDKRNFRKQIRGDKETPVFHKFHEKKAGTPTAGGVIIWATVIGLAIIFWIASRLFPGSWGYLNFINRAETYLPLIALFIAALLGLVDDWLGTRGIGGASGGGLKIRQKSIIYIIIAAIGAWWFYFKLGWDVINVPLIGNFQIGAWYIPIFIFIIFASAFSANETDGLDGLFGGVALFAFVALITVAFILHRYDLAAFGAAIVGALLAFLWYNIYPARFFMGDTGSMSLGITIGVIAMLTNTTLLLPFFAIILVVESLSVIVQLASKKIRGKKIFLSTPLHHHFEAKGWPESQVTMRFWIISALSAVFGLVIFFLSRFL
ncbi:MAG: phospho-N-acetylmuramoyl-pentapeptide-transferase [Patescibacteria group bacterium]|nr:phospho-N-acetylmuramoyl-pentapeptide-transferase [Patescibacteria group bacterium]MDE2015826.1 phospho-N-acetylmuramoyl-pentapeptide-transferase [Patescibacteria group bacterium]MDE2227201.1 phospho-N-acetylmuramoyl-pentapeptide-transferase [Patescibacteria group bacterium]